MDDAVADATEVTKREGHQGSEKRAVKPTKEETKPNEYLSRGTLVGRYVVIDILGEGGMGVVYGAFDPELDRKVAIKLLQANEEGGSTASGDQAWLLREAQALARLSHPNVVAVHDVGTLPGDRVFVAMELVDGITLRAWLKGEPKPWRDIVEIMRAAGAGLAAAHAAGLVHRDFKPDNVLVGKDGRVRVMDFGLARLKPGDADLSTRSSDISGSEISGRSPLSEQLTLAGTVVGTPAYMAPEIHAGNAADARGDQFAYGVAFYEALFRTRPYDKKDLHPPVPGLRPKAPPDNKVPPQIRRAVMRAIAVDHDERYDSMDALLADLKFDPDLRKRRVMMGVGALAVAGAVGGGIYAMQRQQSEVCTGTERRLAGVWDDSSRAAVRTAFDATKIKAAAQSFGGLEKALDAYAGEWVKTSRESCEATRKHGDQTEEVMSLRQLCLDQRLVELQALVKIMTEPNPSLVDKGEKAVFELEPIAKCNNVAALKEPGKPSAEIRPQVLELHLQLATAKAQMIAGQYLPALVSAQKAAEGAKKVNWPPIQGEAQGVRGAVLMASGSFEEAAGAFAETAFAGMAGRRDDLIIAGALSSAMCVASGLGKPAEAKVWLQFGEAAMRRNTSNDPRAELTLHQVNGIVLAESGDPLGAAAAHEKAFNLAKKIYGEDGPSLFADESTYATTLTKAWQFAKSVPHFEHAIKLREATVGPEHPDVALILSNLGIAYRRLYQHDKAHAALDRALAIREKVYGKNSPLLVPTLDNLTDLLRQEGNIPKAIETIDKARRLAGIVPGKDHFAYHQVTTDYAEVLIVAGRNKDAHDLLAEVLELQQKSPSTVSPHTNTIRAELALRESKWADADSYATTAIALYEKAGGTENPELWRPLSAKGRALLELGKTVDALPVLERANEIGTRIQLHDNDLAATRAALARAKGT